ncbi:MAG: hypothetical protein J7L35_04380, partial [Anaerolineales bacterium]|nr:hypothetical protein [Anaerolineales bacterium]
MDDNTHLVMASRTLFDFPDLTLLIGRRMVKGIGFDELAFQTREIKSYYREILQRDITDEETETLLDRTEGWITGLVFSVYTNLAHLPGSGKKGKITGVDLFQYLADQVLEKQSQPIQDFLLRSSLFDEFNAEFCNQVLGQPDSGSWDEMISTLQQKNLFIQQVDDENSWIRYHTLFRDFLRARFRDLYPQVEKNILSRLLELYRGSESWEKAFEIARQTGNPKLMAEVIDQANSDLIHQGRMKLLSSWLDLLPEEGFDLVPKLLILRGISITSIGNPKKGLSYITNIISHPSIANDPQLEIRATLCRITTYRILGHYTEALTDIEYVFEKLITEDINETLLAETNREAALAYLNIGNYPKSKNHFVNSLNSYTNLGDINNQAFVHQDMGLLLMENGFFHEAAHHFEIALDTWEKSNNISQQSNILNNIGTLSVLTGKYKESAKLLQSAISCAKASLNSRIHAFAIASQGDLAKSISLYEIGLEKYERANTISEQIQEGYLISYLVLNKSTLLRYIGKYVSAGEFLQVAHTFISQGSSRNELGTWHLEMGFLQLALKEYRTSRESFFHAEEIFKIIGKPLELARAQMGLVLVNHKMSKSRSVQKHIKDWIASLMPLETYHPLLPELNFQGQKVK